jgi:hypothetical protein
MRSVVDSEHFLGRAALDARVNKTVAAIPGATLITDRETSGIPRLSADHYVDQFKVISGDEVEIATETYIDIHHIGNTGGKKLFPTIIRIIETSNGQSQADIFSIDDHGNILVHTHMSGDRVNSADVRDTSRERLMLYREEILARIDRYPITLRMRLIDALWVDKAPSGE